LGKKPRENYRNFFLVIGSKMEENPEGPRGFWALKANLTA